jgi:hypothetical protein
MEKTRSRNALAGLGAFFMDTQLEKYRFGRTLTLSASAYQFGTDTTIPVYASSICKYAPLYFLNEGVTLVPNGQNSYICSGITSINIIRLILEAYWNAVTNQCADFTES